MLLLATVIFGYPLLWMVFGAGKADSAFFDNLWGPPAQWTWSNFSNAWQVSHMGRYLLNSTIITGSTIILVAVLAYPLAYAIARLRFAGSGALLGAFAVFLFVPIQLTVVPLFDLNQRLGLLDTYWSMVLPYAASSLPFAVIFVTAYLRSIPRELEEAAVIDGASRLTVLLRILLPLSRPAFATLIVFTFLNVWNELLIALTMTQSDTVRPISVGLLNFSQTNGQTDYANLFAALTLSALPVFAVFMLCQRQFINGLMSGAVKL